MIESPRTLLTVLFTSTLTGCATVDSFSSRATQFNLEAEQTQNEVLLLNIVRSSMRRPREFTALQTVSGTASASGGLSLGIPFGRNNGANALGLTSSASGGRSLFGMGNPLENNLRRALRLDGDSSTARARELRDSRDFFGPGESSKLAPKLTPAELLHRDAFMQIHNPNYTPSASGATPSGGLFAPDRSFYDPPKPAVVRPSVILPGNPGNVAGSSTPYTPSYVPPVTPAPPAPAAAPVSPFMSVPRRNY